MNKQFNLLQLAGEFVRSKGRPPKKGFPCKEGVTETNKRGAWL